MRIMMLRNFGERLAAHCRLPATCILGATLAPILLSCGVHISGSSLERNFVSLEVGNPLTLVQNPPAGLTWASDNPFVEVSNDGRIEAQSDHLGADARTKITATSADHKIVHDVSVTIVNWTANRSSLVLVDHPDADDIFFIDSDKIYFSRSSDLYESHDSFGSSSRIGRLPKSTEKVIKTECGFFARTGTAIYRTGDLKHWTDEFEVRPSAVLQHMFSTYFDPQTSMCYVYTGEYTSDNSTDLHAAYRGAYFADGRSEWKKILEFDSLATTGSANIARHFHVVTVDPYTGQVWVGTGDADEHSRIMYSDDHGDSFRLIGMGQQRWRTLSIWFTATHVYWNMDSTNPQSVWRIPRSVFDKTHSWPTMTPELSTGMTQPGRRYLVTANESPSYFGVPIGSWFTETKSRALSAVNRARVIDDPAFAYYEEVAQLFNGSQWYTIGVKNKAGEYIQLMGAAPEGALRDFNGRVFGIMERTGLKPDVQELLQIHSSTPDTYLRFLQLEPRGQDAQGYIYFVGRDTLHRIYKMTLDWNDTSP
jgi:hypothetical protein